MAQFAVLASGNGGNLQAIIDAVKSKKITSKLRVVISDKAAAFALVRAQKAGIESLYINPKDFPDRESFDRRVVEALKKLKIDYVILAGYMRLLSPYFIKVYRNKIINIHPALLPSFKGVSGIKDAFEYGVKVTGITIHYVTEEMDAGEIIAQEAVTIAPKDTLESLGQKIHAAEHALYPKIIEQVCRGKRPASSRRNRPR